MPRKKTAISKTKTSKGHGGGNAPDFVVDQFFGLATAVKDPKQIKKGAAVDSLNWLTGKINDHIELRMGTALLGLTRQTGNGKITGLRVGLKKDSSQIPFYSHGRKVKYYNAATNDTVEVGSNLLPAAASGEDVSFDIYSNLAGAFIYLSSPNSGIYKIPVANPGSAVDQASNSFKGWMRIKQNRMFLWNNLVKTTGYNDKTGLNLSYIDKTTLSQYTTVTGEVLGVGDGATKTFAGTLAAIAAKRTVFLIQIAATTGAGTETFLDDGIGGLSSNFGGTGTINYATGAYSVTFNGAPSGGQNVTATYFWEDATSTGICDFSYSTPRTAGQGDYFAQADGGGALMNVFTYGPDEYCMHQLKTWILTMTGTDTSATNLIYRRRVGIPYMRAGEATDDGVPYLDFFDKTSPRMRYLTIPPTSTVIVPEPLSDNIDLSQNGFDAPIVYDWADYFILCCQSILNGVNQTYNDVMYLYNKFSKAWDKLDYPATALDIYNGQLLAGDPISNNVFKFFSGYDDDGFAIKNFWTSGQHDLNIDGQKRVNKFVIDGYINPAQSLDIYLYYDNGSGVKIGTIAGNGTYVDLGSGILVGANTVGSEIVGASSPGAVNAYHFRQEFTIASDRFEFVQVRFQATAIGALQINTYKFSDIRYKGRKVSPQYYS